MPADIIAMPGVEPVEESDEPCADVIEMLERWLAEARAGRLRAVALIGLTSRGKVSEGWRAAPDEGASLLAGTVYLQQRLAQAAIEESVPSFQDGA